MKESKDRGVYVDQLSQHQVKSVEEMDALLKTGTENRVVGATKMNPGSSRSHSIFSIEVELAEQTDPKEKARIRKGKLHLVDLAGFEIVCNFLLNRK